MTNWNEWSPTKVHRYLSGLEMLAERNDDVFRLWDAESVQQYGIAPKTGNALYISIQARDYLTTMEKAALASDEREVKAYGAHARSEMSRILALCQRECLRNGWDFIQTLQEGVEYETEVVRTRTAADSKYIQRG